MVHDVLGGSLCVIGGFGGLRDGGVERGGEGTKTVFDIEMQGFGVPVLEEAAFAEGLLGGFARGPEVAAEG